MKSYIQGLITGASLVFGFMVLTGSNADAYYDTDDIYSKLGNIESSVSSIKSEVSSIESDVSFIKIYGVDCN
jgi:hypothetical protein